MSDITQKDGLIKIDTNVDVADKRIVLWKTAQGVTKNESV